MKILLLAASLCAPGLFAPGSAFRPSPGDAVCEEPAEPSQQPIRMCSDAGRACSVDRNCCSGTCSKGTCQ